MKAGLKRSRVYSALEMVLISGPGPDSMSKSLLEALYDAGLTILSSSHSMWSGAYEA
jgi:hypothetical protein